MTLITKPAVDAQENQEKMIICFYLQDGVEVLDFAGPMEAFSYAGFKVFTVSKTTQPIKSQGILTVTPDFSIKDAPPYEILAVFGGNASPTSRDPEVIDWIKARKQNTRYFFSVCTGAFIFGRAGLLDSLTATTFHLSIEDLRRSFPKTRVLTGVRYVDNGKVITTAGISAGIDGALHLIAKLKGADEARRIAEMMEYDKWVPGQGLVVGETK
jgi:transcriptional regulator GlxA family with amidase domain